MKADAELIAKVLDGRATPEERARVLAEADQSPELLELLADSAAALEGETSVVPMESRRARRPVVVGIAAALVAAGMFFLWPRGGHSGVPPFPHSLTVSNYDAARRGANVASVRGSADNDQVLQSVIIGARLTDFQLLGSDTARATAAVEIASALRAISGGAVAATQFESEGLTPAVLSAIEAVADLHALRAAQWLELTRVSALAGDWGTLGRADLRAAIAAIEGDQSARILAQINAKGDARAIADLASQALVALARR